MSWETVQLGSIVDFKGGGTPDKSVNDYWNGHIPWASVKDLKSTDLSRTADTITQAGLDNSASNLIPRGTIIVPTRMAVGKAAITGVDLAINQDLKALIPKADIDTRYLLRVLLAYSDRLLRFVTGATVKGITLDVLRALEVPLPPPTEQRRIAAILDQADTLRRLSSSAIGEFDQIVEAEYFCAFGDPVAEASRWSTCRLSDALEEIEGGWSPNCLDRSTAEGEWGVLKLGAVTYGRFDPTANKALPLDLAARPHLEVKRGDLLFTRKNTYDLVGASVLVNEHVERLLIPDLIFRLKLKNRNPPLQSAYLQSTLASKPMRTLIKSLASGAAGSMPNISKSRLANLPIPVPPWDLQERFSAFRTTHESKRATMLARHRKFDALFASLQQRAFSGEL